MERLREKKQKKQNKEMIKKSILKIIVISIIVGLNWTGLLAVGKTLAYFFDNENSNANTYQASTLDFSLTSPNLNKSIGLTEKLFLGSVLTNSGSLAFQYTVASEKISGSDNFCDALELEAELNWVEKHNGSLMSFDVLVSPTLGSWSFEIKLPVTATNISHGETCEVDLVFKGWQTDVATYEDGGFSDEERIHLKFTSRMVVLNEFLPRPDGEAYGFDFGDDSSTMLQGEWVELYNNSDVNYDLAGWYIWDASADDSNKISITNSNTQPASTIILGNSWLVVYMNKAVLDNTGDTVKLFDDTNALIDSYTYIADNDYCEIEPTPGDENTTTTTGSCGGVPPNKSYARIPDGIGYWVDPIPTPGGPNILESEIINQEEVIEEEPVVEEEPIEEPIDEIAISEEEISAEQEPLGGEEEEPVVEEEPPVNEEEPPVNEEPPVEEEEPSITEEAEPPVEEEPDEEIPVTEEEPIGEEVATEEGGIIEEINEIIDEIIEEIVEEIMSDETTNEPVEEAPAEETITDETILEPDASVIEETPIIEEAPVDETVEETVDETVVEETVSEPEAPVIEEAPIIEEAPAEAPAVEEQPAAVPDDSSSTPGGVVESVSDGGSISDGESGGGGGEIGVSPDGGSPAEGAGESSIDSGGAGDTISE